MPVELPVIKTELKAKSVITERNPSVFSVAHSLIHAHSLERVLDVSLSVRMYWMYDLYYKLLKYNNNHPDNVNCHLPQHSRAQHSKTESIRETDT